MRLKTIKESRIQKIFAPSESSTLNPPSLIYIPEYYPVPTGNSLLDFY